MSDIIEAKISELMAEVSYVAIAVHHKRGVEEQIRKLESALRTALTEAQKAGAGGAPNTANGILILEAMLAQQPQDSEVAQAIRKALSGLRGAGTAEESVIRNSLTTDLTAPKGWKLVPVESTAAMEWAFERAITTYRNGIGRCEPMDTHSAFKSRYAALLAASPTPLQEARCEYCDGTGDVHSLDGEWRGRCTCPAGAYPASTADQGGKAP